MNIGILALVSAVSNRQKIEQSLQEYTAVFEEFAVDFLAMDSPKEIERYNPIFIFVKTGGTENQLKKIYPYIKGEVYFLTTPFNNSLAAAMEMLTWLKRQGGTGEIIHGTPDEVREQISAITKIKKAGQKMARSVLGLIGPPSDWLIASMVDPAIVKSNWGVEIKELAISEVIDYYHQVGREEGAELAREITRKAVAVKESDLNDLEEAVRLYLALQELIKQQQLSAITIRCFDLVGKIGTTGCLALSLLNDQGIIAGCEGDVPTTLSMMLAYYLTDSVSFMANPVSIDSSNRKVKFAHCTIPFALSRNYLLRSHFETGKGIGIQGIINEGPVTVFKIGGENLAQYIIMPGQLLINTDDHNCCRTQIEVKVDNLDYFLTEPIGNHHLIIPGDHSYLLNKYFSAQGRD